MSEFNRQLSHSSPPITMFGQDEAVPEEIQEEILCRLSARKVCQFRSVCDRWKVLTAAPQFVRMHLKRLYENYPSELLIEKQVRRGSNSEKSIQLRLSESFKNSGSYESSSPHSSLYSLHLDSLRSDAAASAGRISGGCSRKTFSFSALGFFVLRVQKLSSSRCVILNPITREKVKLMIAYEDVKLDGRVYAIFWHPKHQEVCVLWGQRERLSPVTIEFKLLNLKSGVESGNSCWRKIIPRLHRYSPRRCSDRVVPPVILNDVLYWMVDCKNGRVSCEDAILAFDVQAEEFKMLSHPPGQFCDGVSRNHKWMHLLQKKNEHLTLSEFSPSDESITTWERHSGKWIMKHRVVLRSPGLDDCCRVFGMMDDESVLLKVREFGPLFVVNLKQGNVQVLAPEDDENRHSFVCSHTPSFASLTSSNHGGEVRVQVPTGVRPIKHLKHVVY